MCTISYKIYKISDNSTLAHMYKNKPVQSDISHEIVIAFFPCGNRQGN